MQNGSECFRELGPSARSLTPSIHVGIDTLPNQQVNLEMKKGFNFNILCLGETGIGKTKLLQTLFKRTFIDEPHFTKSDTVSYTSNSYEISEGNVNIQLTLVESAGFGDQINKNNAAESISTFLDSQFDNFMNEEMKAKRTLDKYRDTRIHVCLYIISPTGHSLKSWDILTLKELDSRVNIIPIIGKADILTKSELKEFKIKVLEELKESGIRIYSFPADDPLNAARNIEMNERIPFAVIASAEEEMINGKMCRVRKYPWGTAIVDDDMHCEFLFLREMLLKTNLYDLVRHTHEKHYENYRCSKLMGAGFNTDSDIGETIKRKKSELSERTEKEITQIKQKYEKDINELEEETRLKKAELTSKYAVSNASDEKKQEKEKAMSRKSKKKLK